MLPPNFLEQLEEQAVELYNDLELQIIEEIATRIANFKYANTVVANDVKIAQEMGFLYENIVQMVASQNNKTYEEIQSLFNEAGIKTIKLDDNIYKEAGLNPIPIKQNKAMLQLLTATAKKTNGNLQNLCLTTANTAQTEFYNAINTAYIQASTGVKSYSTAIIDAIKQVSKQGATVKYPSGRQMNIESAVRMNIVTGINQMCGKLQLLRAEELEWDLMELTAHLGARPTHAQWQGKIVSLSGQSGYLSLNDIGYGTAAGFKGINCRHDWMPFYQRKYKDIYKQRIRKNGK